MQMFTKNEWFRKDYLPAATWNYKWGYQRLKPVGFLHLPS